MEIKNICCCHKCQESEGRGRERDRGHQRGRGLQRGPVPDPVPGLAPSRGVHSAVERWYPIQESRGRFSGAPDVIGGVPFLLEGPRRHDGLPRPLHHQHVLPVRPSPLAHSAVARSEGTLGCRGRCTDATGASGERSRIPSEEAVWYHTFLTGAWRNTPPW